jgi:lysine 2,3-aminomutase
LAQYPPLYIHTHFNHPQEITQASLLAATRLANHGINLANQTVLLKNINDDAAIIKRLNHLLLLMRIRPYYLFQGDMTTSTGHFRTSIQKGLEILDALHGQTSAMAIPRYAVDLPDGAGKVPLLPNYLIKQNSPEITLRNYQGKICTYWEY